MSDEIIVEKNTDSAISVSKTVKTNKFHSDIEKMYVEDILKINLNDISKEIDDRLVIQHKDSKTNIPCFNATAKRVLIRDDNGERLIINNHEEIKKQQLKNSGKLNAKQISNEKSEVISEDEIEFND